MIFTIFHREETSDIKERNKEKKINPFIKKKKKKNSKFPSNNILKYDPTLFIYAATSPPSYSAARRLPPPAAAEKITQEFIRVGETQLFQSGRG